MKFIAVNGFTYAITDQSPLETITAVITVMGTPSFIHKVNGAGFCYDGFTLQINNVATIAASIVDPGPFTATFSATAVKEKELLTSKFPLRVDDKTDVIFATPKIPNPPGSPTPHPVSFRITITNAGQLKVQCN